MKRTLWVASSVAVLALPVGVVTARGLAGSRTADRAIGSILHAHSVSAAAQGGRAIGPQPDRGAADGATARALEIDAVAIGV